MIIEVLLQEQGDMTTKNNAQDTPITLSKAEIGMRWIEIAGIIEQVRARVEAKKEQKAPKKAA